MSELMKLRSQWSKKDVSGGARDGRQERRKSVCVVAAGEHIQPEVRFPPQLLGEAPRPSEVSTSTGGPSPTRLQDTTS